MFALLCKRSTSHDPCGLCQCTLNGPTTFWDFRSNAPWHTTIWTAQTWHHWPERPQCVLLNSRLANGLFVHYDIMHSKWLGWCQYLYGTIFWMLCFEQMPQSPLENLIRLGRWIRAFQSHHKVSAKYSQGLTKLTMFQKKTDYPKLRGKAIEIRDLAYCMVAAWKYFGDCSSAEGQKVLRVLELNAQQDDLLKISDAEQFALSPEEYNTLLSATVSMESKSFVIGTTTSHFSTIFICV